MLLSDTDIEVSHLVCREFDHHCLRGCTYEFRVSDIAYRYDYDARVSRQERSSVHTIAPFETVTVITKETVCMDKSHFLSLFSKGFLFSLGVVPVCTGADPGFEGRLGITLTNMSARPINLPVDTRFIKGVFHRLTRDSAKPYAGQHGDATVSWPYPAQFHSANFAQEEYLANMNRFLPRSISEAVAASLRTAKLLGSLIWLLALIAVLDISSYVASHFLAPNAGGSRLVDVLNIVGALASVIALVLTAIQQVKIVGLRRDKH
jgi:deoxycytidine triphosphate deaminase